MSLECEVKSKDCCYVAVLRWVQVFAGDVVQNRREKGRMGLHEADEQQLFATRPAARQLISYRSSRGSR